MKDKASVLGHVDPELSHSTIQSTRLTLQCITTCILVLRLKELDHARDAGLGYN
jgi:hypothetical protein